MSLPPLPVGMMWRHYEDAGGRKIAQQVPIPDYIPYDEPDKVATLAELQDQSVKAYAELWRALRVTAEDENSNTSETSLGHEFVACLTRLDQRMSNLMEMVVAMTGQMQEMALNQKKMYGMILHIINEMAGEVDEDEPRTYMDGSPI